MSDFTRDAWERRPDLNGVPQTLILMQVWQNHTAVELNSSYMRRRLGYQTLVYLVKPGGGLIQTEKENIYSPEPRPPPSSALHLNPSPFGGSSKLHGKGVIQMRCAAVGGGLSLH